jgi:predicted kinase
LVATSSKKKEPPMITVIALLRARDGLTREEFIDYYEHHHAPLALRLAPAPVSYTRTYLPARDQRECDADFDVITQIQFEDEKQQEAWRALAEHPLIIKDEERFLNRSCTKGWVVEQG